MKTFRFLVLLALPGLYTCGITFGQTIEYKKISLSIHVGMDFPIGTSNTAGDDRDFTVPFSKGFGGTFDGAYFLTKNYGVGLKYHFYSGNGDGDLYNGDKAVSCEFDETTHFIGASLHGRWFLGTRWEIPVNISVGNVHNKLSDYHEAVFYIDNTEFFEYNNDYRVPRFYSRYDMTCNAIGIMFAAGIRYRIIPAIAIGIYADGMFSGAKKQMATDYAGKSIDIDVSRKMNKIGFSGGLDFSF